MGDATFIEITNKDIYDKIVLMEEKNTFDHTNILLHQKATNGKVKLNRWIATTALTLIVAIGGVMSNHLLT